MPHLVRFTSLKPRTIRAIILALVQHNLLWHVELEGEGEVLEFNEEECLMRLRFGRFITLAGRILGEAVRADTFTGDVMLSEPLSLQAARIISIVLQHGKLRQPEMLQYLQIFDAKGMVSGPGKKCHAHSGQNHRYIRKLYMHSLAEHTSSLPRCCLIFPKPIGFFAWKETFGRITKVFRLLKVLSSGRSKQKRESSGRMKRRKRLAWCVVLYASWRPSF